MDKEKKEEQQNRNDEPTEKKTTNNNLEDPQQEFEDLLDKLKEQYNLDRNDLKIVRVTKKKITLRNMLFPLLFSFLLDLVIIVALNGYLQYTDADFLRLLLFSVLFTIIEAILKQLLMRYIFRLILMSFGLITIPITIVSFVLAIIIVPGFNIENTGKLILFFIIFMIIRLTIKMFFMRRNLLKQRGNNNVKK